MRVNSASASDTLAALRQAGMTGIFAGGEWLPASRTYPTLNPTTGEELATVADSTPAEVDAVASRAALAWVGWREISALERADAGYRFADLLQQHAEELAILDAIDAGNPIQACRRDIQGAIANIRYFAGIATQARGETVPTASDTLDFTLRESFGVVARITPFNHPALFACKAIAAPVLAGNAVLLKPSPHTPLTAARIVQLAAEVLPPGIVNLVTGGSDTALALARHPLIRRIALTGSYQAGLAITRAAAERDLKVITLECGGKNPLIALEDADVEAVASAAVQGMNFTSCAGQSCGSTSRLFIHESLYDGVLELVAAQMEGLKLGDPLSDETNVGPLISAVQREKTEEYVRIADNDGARLVVGGNRPNSPELARGYFYNPTLISDVAPSSRVWVEEVFGPLLSATRWTSLVDVARSANAVEYGLTAAIWTSDLDKAIWLARGLQAGYIWVNGVTRHELGAPFGGYKNSGTGREECLDELLSYTQVKNVNVRTAHPMPPLP